MLLPAYSIVLVLLTYFTYFALAFADTPGFADICTITGAFSASLRPVPGLGLRRRVLELTPSCATDPKAHLPELADDPHAPSPYVSAAQPGAVPLMYDVPIGLVNRVMYSGRSTRSRARTVPPG